MDCVPKKKAWGHIVSTAPSGFNRQPWLVERHKAGWRVQARTGGAAAWIEGSGRYTWIDLGCLAAYLVARSCSDVLVSAGRGDRCGVSVRVAGGKGRTLLVPGGNPQVLEKRRTHRAPLGPAGTALVKIQAELGDRAQIVSAGEPGWKGAGRWQARFETLSLRCPEVRREVFRGIAGEPEKGTGIPVECLGLPAGVGAVFRRLFRHPDWEPLWRVAAPVYGRIALSRIRSASALVAFSLAGQETPETLVDLGMRFTRWWLRLTAEGLAAQPYSSFVYPRLCGRRCGRSRCLVDPESWREHFDERPEILFRVGRPTRPVPPRPHRPIEDVLVVEE